MKRKLLLLVLLLSTSYCLNAQVIDIIGKGVIGVPNPNLPISDIDNVDHVDVGAILKAPRYEIGEVPDINGVKFSDNDESPGSIWNSLNEHPGETRGFYSANFNTVDVGGINTEINIGNINSFYAYIYRNIPESSFRSFADLETVFMFHNGSSSPHIFDIPINTAPLPRNILVKIPITELDMTKRMVDITIDAGGLTRHIVENTYGILGNSFFLGEYIIENVPGDVANVTVSIYSPDPTIDGLENDGDSFFVSGVVIDVDIVYNGCTLTQGYWKTHSNCKTNGNGKGNGPERDDTWVLIGPDDNGTIGELSTFMEYEDLKDEQNYCDVFDTNPGKGGKYYILAHQYIAAELNILSGASPYPDAFNKAKAFLEDNTPNDVKGDPILEAICVELGGILADFNEGAIGPGHCDNDDTASKVLSVDEMDSIDTNVKIYPNPVTSMGKISFVPKQNAETSVEVYNVLGQKISVLYNEYTMRGVPVSVDYDAQRFKEGIHFVHIKNGSSTVTKKLSISK